MSVAPHAGVVDFGTFTPPTASKDGIQGEVPKPLIGQANYVLTGNGWSSLGALGALTYQGTWDASTNTPTLVSSVGTQGYYYVVSVAGNTDLNGITTWDVGDWVIFNGSVWQKLEGGAVGTFTNVITPQVTARTDNLTLSAISTGAVNLNTAGGTGFKISDNGAMTSYWETFGGTGTNILFANGSTTNITALYKTKGTGGHQFTTAGSNSNTQLNVAHTASAVNYVQATGSVTNAAASALGGLSFTGSDANPNFAITTKGTGYIAFCGSGATNNQSFRISNAYVANTGNLFQVQSVGAGFAPSLSVISGTSGTDANISMAFQPKGTGAIDLAAGSSGVNISNGGTVTALTRTVAGVNYTTAPTVAISAPTTAGGVQATATVSIIAYTVTVANGGTGYTVGDTLTLVGGTPITTGATYTVATVSSGVVTSVNYLAYNGYSAIPTSPAATTGGTGTGCTLNLTGVGINSAFTITNAGSGYIEQPTVTFSGGGGSSAAAYATVGSGTLLKSLGVTQSFYTPGGETMRLIDPASGTVNRYLEVRGGISGSSGVRVGVTNEALDFYTTSGYPFYFATQGARSAIQFVVNHITSSVNYLQATGSVTASSTGPILSTQGSDTNVPMQIQGKGTGSVAVLTPTALGGTTGNTAELFAAKGFNTNAIWLRASQYRNATGTDWQTASLRLGQRIDATDMSYIEFNPSGFPQGIAIQTANNQPINFNTSGAQFRVGVASSSVNYIQASGGATTKVPILSSQGSDTNVSLGFQSKGTGAIDLAPGSLGVNISNGTTVTGTTLLTRGSGYTAFPVVSVSAPTAPNGVQAVITALLNLNTLTLVSGGTGYTALDVLTVSGVTGGTVTVRVDTVTAGVISTFTVTNFGSGSVSAIPANPVSVTGGTGTGATFNADWNCGNLTIGTAGSGYLEQPTITFSGGVTNATAFVSIGSAPIVKGLGGTQLNFATAGGTNFAVSDSNLLAPASYAFATGGSGSAGFGIISSNANAGLTFTSKGTSAVDFYTNSYGSLGLRVSHTASAVNYIQVTGAATGGFPVISAQGSDSVTGLNFSSKSTGRINFFNQGGVTSRHVSIGGNGTTAVNYIDLNGTTTTNAPVFSVAGTDTNISMAFQPKGTGAIDLAAGSSGVNISNGGTVTAITRTAAGAGYTSLPTMTISAPTTAGGVQATATYTMGLAGVPTITSGGTGYTVGDTLTFVGGTGGAATLTVSTVSAGVITGVTIGSFGTYTALPTNPISVTGGTGSSATFTATWAINSVFTITNAGSGYIEQPTVTFSGGGGSSAAAYATVGSGAIVKALGNNINFNTPNSQVLSIVDKNSGGNYPTNTNPAFTMVPSQNAFGASYLGMLTAGYFATNNTGSGSFIFATGISPPLNGNGGSSQFQIAHTASAVNYVQVTGSATGNRPTISAQGSDTNINMDIVGKGFSRVFVLSANARSAEFTYGTATSIASNNWIKTIGNAGGTAPAIASEGTDTNIDLALTPKGTGRVKFGTLTATADAPITGYIEIVDSGGTIRKLAVIT